MMRTIMDLKWSKLFQYPNGSQSIYHNNKTRGRIVMHLKKGQTIEQYLVVHKRLPNWIPPAGPLPEHPNIVASRLAEANRRRAAAFAKKKKMGNYFMNNIRRGFIELGKPWAITKNSLNSVFSKTHPNKNYIQPNITIRKKNMQLFTNKLKTLGWKEVYKKNNGSFSHFHRTFRANGGGLVGTGLYLRGSNTNNFRARTKLRNKVPVLN